LESPADESDLIRADRVAVLAHWDPDARVRRSPQMLTQALIQAGYLTFLVSTAVGDSPLAWIDGRPGGVTVLRRPNLGYDFGSWATALELLPAISRASWVLLVNDSLVGPFGPIDHLLDRFHRSHADVWGMTDTEQLGHHLQCYCLGFRNGCLNHPELSAFWRGIRVEASRDDVIHRYEVGLSRVLRHAKLSTEAAIEGWRAVDGDDNPTIIGWRRLLDLGFPFVKRQVLLDPSVCRDGHEAPAELRRRFGIDISDWL
jgi:lipopolysaccharide biosynthesis protein